MHCELRISNCGFRIVNSQLAIRNSQSRRYQSNGFTFVEILIALVVLATVVTPLMQMYATAVEQVGYIDDLRTGLDLAREEVEKVKNLALTEDQLKQLGNIINPPIQLNNTLWYTVRFIDPSVSPLIVQVFVYRDQLGGQPMVSLLTSMNK